MTAQHLTELDPETASLLLMGDTARRDEDYKLAVHCYQRALARRSGHPGGLFNLAVCSMYIDELELALDALEELEAKLASDDGDVWNELRLSGCYNAVLVHWYLAEKRHAHATHLAEAVRKSRSMALVIATDLRDPAATDEHRAFLGSLAGASIALLAALLVETFAHRVLPAADADADARALALRSGDGADNRLTQRLKTIRPGMPEPDPEWVAPLASETWHQPRTALTLAMIARKTYGADPRTRYNLAVMQARLLRGAPPQTIAERAAHARADLEYALESEPFRERWARRDNLLTPLRTADPGAYDKLFEPGAHPA